MGGFYLPKINGGTKVPKIKHNLGFGPIRKPKLLGAKHRGLRQHGGRSPILYYLIYRIKVG